ncbi:MAG: hypothetical protein H6563_08620 [Lewinellaceae bacterium]|nr:hypothetical protein [Lewinellaceae bacterium]
MSQLNKILLIASFLFAIQPTFAATVVVDHPATAATEASAQEVRAGAEKMSFRERLATKILDKKIKKAMQKSEAHKAGNGGNILSLLSLIFGGASLILLWVFGILGLLLALTAIILGIIGSKKENSKVMAILGIVFGSLTLFLVLLAVAFLASLLTLV